jgi:L-ornithine Nalpha-acyltransferase
MVLPEYASTRPVDVRVGDIEIRLAESEEEVRAAQALRYRVFYEEMAARPTPEMQRIRRDFDSYDPFCDHLLVIDRSLAPGKGVVGTYRLLRRTGATQRGQFYSVDEYDIRSIQAFAGEILELGRSCIEAAYRQRPVMQLMWRGIADYVMYYEIGLMFGCASLPGVDPAAHAVALSYLYHYHLAPANLRPRALPERYAGHAATAGQGLSQAGWAGGRWRRGRSPVPHHGCLHRRRHRPGNGKILSPLHPDRRRSRRRLAHDPLRHHRLRSGLFNVNSLDRLESWH